MPEFQRLLVDCEVGHRLDAPPKDRTPTQQKIKLYVFPEMRDVDLGAESASSFCGWQSSRNSWSGVRPLQHTNHADDMSPKQRGEAEKFKGSRSREPGGKGSSTRIQAQRDPRHPHSKWITQQPWNGTPTMRQYGECDGDSWCGNGFFFNTKWHCPQQSVPGRLRQLRMLCMLHMPCMLRMLCTLPASPFHYCCDAHTILGFAPANDAPELADCDQSWSLEMQKRCSPCSYLRVHHVLSALVQFFLCRRVPTNTCTSCSVWSTIAQTIGRNRIYSVRREETRNMTHD